MAVGTKARSAAVWLPETLNLKTNHHLRKDAIQELDDHELILQNGSTRRAVASSVTGIVVNSTLAYAVPVFAVGVPISIWQTGVSTTNHARVKREIRRRCNSEKDGPAFRVQLEQEDHPIRDVMMGCSIKTACMAVSCGIVGFDQIAQNFADVSHFSPHALVDNVLLQHTAAAHTSHLHHLLPQPNSSQFAPSQQFDYAHQFEARHPEVAALDTHVNVATSGLGGFLSTQFAHSTDVNFADNASWADVHAAEMLGVKPDTLVCEAVAVGVTGEFVTPLVVVEPGADAAMEHWSGAHEKEARRKNGEQFGKQVGRHMEVMQELRRWGNGVKGRLRHRRVNKVDCFL